MIDKKDRLPTIIIYYFCGPASEVIRRRVLSLFEAEF